MQHLDVIKLTCVTLCPLSKQLTRGKYYKLHEVSCALENTGVLKLHGKENRRLPSGSSREEKRKEKKGMPPAYLITATMCRPEISKICCSSSRNY
jgi:hypothetical protein